VLPLAFVVACAARGGGPPPSTSPAGGAAPSADRVQGDQEADTPREVQTVAPAPQGAQMQPMPAQPGRPPVGSVEELRAAELELASAGDCATACRALRSMERAATHLCGVAATDEDRRACDDARVRVSAAQDRVQRTCGGCGP
jgi:hypothetical protein